MVLLALPAPQVQEVRRPKLLEPISGTNEIPMDAIGPANYYTGTGARWGAARFAEQLASRHQQFTIRFGRNVSFSDLTQSPSILFGGVTSPLGMQITSNLRYKFTEENGDAVIVDAYKKGAAWRVTGKAASGALEGYALITVLRHTDSGFPLTVVAGMGAADTQAGAEFLTNNVYLQQFAQRAPKDWPEKNCQIVLQDFAYADSPSQPTIVAWYVW